MFKRWCRDCGDLFEPDKRYGVVCDKCKKRIEESKHHNKGKSLRYLAHELRNLSSSDLWT